MTTLLSLTTAHSVNITFVPEKLDLAGLGTEHCVISNLCYSSIAGKCTGQWAIHACGGGKSGQSCHMFLKFDLPKLNTMNFVAHCGKTMA